MLRENEPRNTRTTRNRGMCHFILCIPCGLWLVIPLAVQYTAGGREPNHGTHRTHRRERTIVSLRSVYSVYSVVGHSSCGAIHSRWERTEPRNTQNTRKGTDNRVSSFCVFRVFRGWSFSPLIIARGETNHGAHRTHGRERTIGSSFGVFRVFRGWSFLLQ